MELKIFTTFRTIVRTGSLTKAARLLSYTPSTITFHVAQLEKLAGVPLFEKNGRRMVLTKAGEALVPYVDEVLAATKKIRNFQYGVADLRRLRRTAKIRRERPPFYEQCLNGG